MTTDYLPRRAASGYLAGLGLKCAVSTLANLATLGGGPEMVKFGARVFYTPKALERWVADRAVVRRDTSDPGRPLSIVQGATNFSVAG